MSSVGGPRANSGPKPKGSEEAEHFANFEKERAAHEKVKREQREFELGVKQAQYVSRAGVAQAAATVISVFTQTLRTLPDDLERECGLSDEASEMLSLRIDQALNTLAAGLKALAPNG